MPKIFALRHQLAEQQAKLKQQAKGGSPEASPNSSSDEEKIAGGSKQAAQEPRPSASQNVGLDISPVPREEAKSEQNAPLELVHRHHRRQPSSGTDKAPV